jgi:hypothetical protein
MLHFVNILQSTMMKYRNVLLSSKMELGFFYYVFAFGSLVTASQIRNLPAQARAVPASVITPAPILHGDVFKRSIATCGFVRGNSGTHTYLQARLNSRSNKPTSLTVNMSRKLQLHNHHAPRAQLRMLQQHRVHQRLGHVQRLRPERLYRE